MPSDRPQLTKPFPDFPAASTAVKAAPRAFAPTLITPPPPTYPSK